jgi:hypothetical protein
MQLIIACRFIPGGRTAVTLTCGLTGYPRRRFIVATAAAAVIWAVYAFFIGRIGGQAFEDKPWVGLLVACGGTIVISAAIEGIRRLLGRGRDPAPDRSPGGAERDAQGQAQSQAQGQAHGQAQGQAAAPASGVTASHRTG